MKPVTSHGCINTIWFWFANTISMWCSLPMGWEQSYPTLWSQESKKPITFASRTLSKAESRYAQLNGSITIIFRVCKFHQYLYGWNFTFLTDLLPLISYLCTTLGFPFLAIKKMQRWAFLLSAYTYQTQKFFISWLFRWLVKISFLSFKHQKPSLFWEFKHMQKVSQEWKCTGGPKFWSKWW